MKNPHAKHDLDSTRVESTQPRSATNLFTSRDGRRLRTTEAVTKHLQAQNSIWETAAKHHHHHLHISSRESCTVSSVSGRTPELENVCAGSLGCLSSAQNTLRWVGKTPRDTPTSFKSGAVSPADHRTATWRTEAHSLTSMGQQISELSWRAQRISRINLKPQSRPFVAA